MFNEIEKKINSVVFSLASTGIILAMLSILIVWTDFVLRLVVGMVVLVVAFSFLHGSYKLWHLKKDIKKHFKIS
jgi:hypothetical protein